MKLTNLNLKEKTNEELERRVAAQLLTFKDGLI